MYEKNLFYVVVYRRGVIKEGILTEAGSILERLW